jgi:hypothetical protein
MGRSTPLTVIVQHSSRGPEFNATPASPAGERDVQLGRMGFTADPTGGAGDQRMLVGGAAQSGILLWY